MNTFNRKEERGFFFSPKILFHSTWFIILKEIHKEKHLFQESPNTGLLPCTTEHLHGVASNQMAAVSRTLHRTRACLWLLFCRCNFHWWVHKLHLFKISCLSLKKRRGLCVSVSQGLLLVRLKSSLLPWQNWAMDQWKAGQKLPGLGGLHRSGQPEGEWNPGVWPAVLRGTWATVKPGDKRLFSFRTSASWLWILRFALWKSHFPGGTDAFIS